MKSFRIIPSQEFTDSIPVKYYGYREDEIENFHKNYQTKFTGNPEDLLLELISNSGEIYHAIFRSGSSIIGGNTVLQFRDTDKLLIFVKGALYRLTINNQTCHPNDVLFKGSHQVSIRFESDDFAQRYAHAIASEKHQTLILADDEGVCSLTWENVLWKHKFEWAYSGYLELLGIDADQIQIDYYAPDNGGEKPIKLNINSGAFITEPFYKKFWSMLLKRKNRR